MSTPSSDYQELPVALPRPLRVGVTGAPAPQRRSLWVALHGYGERADLMAGRASWPPAPQRTWAFPEAPHRFYVTTGASLGAHADLPVGASWMTRDLREADIAANHRYLDEVVTLVGGAPRLLVFGFSQGAATAARWAAQRAQDGRPPEQVVCWGAALPPELALGPGTPLADVPLHLVCGSRDRWVSEARFEAELARVRASGQAVTPWRFDGGHRVDDPTLAALVQALDP
jgi:predicted esterase